MLRQKGFRVTQVRHVLMSCLQEAQAPMSVQELLMRLAKEGLKPHKTTVYRELTFFVEQGWIDEVELNGRSRAFEWSEGDHHHHLVCRSCDLVEDVELGESEEALFALDRHFQRKSRFSDVRHQLTFSGLCNQCT